MKRRAFNKLIAAIPFLSLPKLSPPKPIVMICDGVKDSQGEYAYPEDINFEPFNKYGLVLRNHKFSINNEGDTEPLGRCQVEFQENNLVVKNYQGPQIEGYLSVRGMHKSHNNGHMKEFELFSIGIHEEPNSDSRIPRVRLG